MGYENLNLPGFFQEIRDVSTGAHPRKFCFVLGAGASKSSGIASGQELVDQWEKELRVRNEQEHVKWKERLGITTDNKYSFYSQYYERRFKKQPSDGYNFLEKLMEHANPSVGYVMLSYILAETNNNVVITTNFDHLIEDSINYYTKTIPLTIGHESLAHYVTAKNNRPTILKIHRDLLFDPKNREEELEELHDNWKVALDKIFSEYHPVFIGYAGNDNSLMEYLANNSKSFIDGKWKFPYWLTYNSEKLSEKVSDFLNQSEGYLIKHSGFDEVFGRLGIILGYRKPTKTDFLSDAENRYNKLSEVIEKLDSGEKGISLSAVVTDEYDEEDELSDEAIDDEYKNMLLWDLYREATTYHISEQYDKALELERVLIQKDPDNANYRASLGATLLAAKLYEEAVEAYQKAVEMRPEETVFYNGLGLSMHALEQYEEAEKIYRKAVEIEPNDAELYDSLALVLRSAERYDDALKESNTAIMLESNNPRFYYNRGITFETMERYDDAAADYKKTVELEPDNEDYQNSLKRALQMTHIATQS